MRYLFTAIILCLVLSAGCRHDGNDPRLVRIAELTGNSPRQALEALDSINTEELSEGDRHLFDLLTIKAKDKEYITHTSDSLILDVISYYDRHRDNPYYPEALYYGGRVYSDLGDYPSALSYFRTAIDILPPDRKNNSLRARLLSQTSSLLNSLRLYDKALPYAEEVLRIDSIEKDTFNLMLDYTRIGSILMRCDKYYDAERNLRRARQFAEVISDHEVSIVDGHLAAVKYNADECDSALKLIRSALKDTSLNNNSFILAYASKIYRSQNINDSAILYARCLINASSPLNKQNAYQLLLSPELIKYLPQDSIAIFVSDFRDVVENYLNQYGKQETLIQNSIYNYQTHVREKERTQRSNSLLQKFLVVAIALVVILIIGILYSKNRNQKRIIELQQALDNIKRSKTELNKNQEKTQSTQSDPIDSENYGSTNVTDSSDPTEESLKDRLREELFSLYKSSPVPPIPEKIIQSEIFCTLQDLILKGNPIKENDKLWDDVKKIVNEVSPKFISNLRLLSSFRLTKIEIQTALLLKCGFKPSQMMILFAKSNGAIISRRESLGLKILGRKEPVKVVDGIIRLL